MKRNHFLPSLAKLFACGWLCAGMAAAETADRILSIDSHITVDRNRTMHVQEKFEIVNDGAFDSGFHRQRWIADASPHRWQPGSYESVTAKLDGRDAVPQVSAAGGVFGVAVAQSDGALSRGRHVIELRYVAKHQFVLYDNIEDLNLNVTGKWPVAVDRASVEFHFPASLPAGYGLSADTGTDSQFAFDCLRTELPNGVRFETNHPLPPGARLFVSARFPHPGYFVSDYNEDGYRAILQNHPGLFAGVASLAGGFVFLIVGIVVWRRPPKPTSANLAQSKPAPVFWRETLKFYRFPLVMFVLAIVPGLNFSYSGHGGPSWFFIPFCFPWVIGRLLVKIAKADADSNRWYKRFFKITIPSYVALAMPLSWLAVTSIRFGFGLPVSPWAFFAIMVSPFPWWFLA